MESFEAAARVGAKLSGRALRASGGGSDGCRALRPPRGGAGAALPPPLAAGARRGALPEKLLESFVRARSLRSWWLVAQTIMIAMESLIHVPQGARARARGPSRFVPSRVFPWKTIVSEFCTKEFWSFGVFAERVLEFWSFRAKSFGVSEFSFGVLELSFSSSHLEFTNHGLYFTHTSTQFRGPHG